MKRRGSLQPSHPLSVTLSDAAGRKEQLTHRLPFHCDNGENDLWRSNVMMAVPQLLVEVAGGCVAGTSVQKNQWVQDRDDRRMAFSFPSFTGPSLPQALNRLAYHPVHTTRLISLGHRLASVQLFTFSSFFVLFFSWCCIIKFHPFSFKT